MAMLSEPRRRQKWSLNPRGSLWVNDDNKFGQKLMEKMGWSKGRGLGKEEQGEKDCVAIRMKDNTKGLGYKGKDDEWIKHYEGFENVLAALNSENNSASISPCNSTPNSNVNSDDEDSKRISLEALSKKSQARVHYHKFTRGKDLSRLDPDEIACITGSKRAKVLAEVAKKEEVKEEEEEIGNVNHSNGVTTIKAGNIQEYFAKKMAKLNGQTLMLNTDALGENDAPGAGYLQDDCEWEDAEKSKGEKKRKDVGGGEDATMQEYEAYDNPECEGKPEKKTKSKKNRAIVEESTFDSKDIKEKKRKKRKHRDDLVHHEYEYETCKGDSYVEESPKKKKKVVVDALENNEGDGENCIVKEPQKKKKKRMSEDVQGKEWDTELLEYEKDAEEVSKKKKKKKKKKKHLEEQYENEGDMEAQNDCNAKEPKSKKKKKSKSIGESI